MASSTGMCSAQSTAEADGVWQKFEKPTASGEVSSSLSSIDDVSVPDVADEAKDFEGRRRLAVVTEHSYSEATRQARRRRLTLVLPTASGTLC